MGNKASPSCPASSLLAMDPPHQRIVNDDNFDQTLYSANSQRLNEKDTGINFNDIKHGLEEGSTIVSTASGDKYTIQYTKFGTQQQYLEYTDTLVNRAKALRSCHKVRGFINRVTGIYGEKVNVCSGCNPCTFFHVYVVQKHYSMSLEDVFADYSQVSYCEIISLLYSFCRVMSAYQYKRLRYGEIDFSKIYVTPSAREWRQLSRLDQSINEAKAGSNFICKVGDPFVRLFRELKQKFIANRTKSLGDVYKESVLKVGLALDQVLKQKQILNLSSSSKLIEEQLKAKEILTNLVQNHMVCGISNRSNWLQIQRHFQQLKSNEKSTCPVSMLQSVNTPYETRHNEPQYRTHSNQKVVVRQAPMYAIPDPLKSYSGRKQPHLNTSLNKENIPESNSSFICLRPYKKSDSKPNILVHGPPQKISKPNIVQSKLQFGPPVQGHIPAPANLTTGNQNRNIFLPSEKNSGYGMVENTHPEYIVGGKIRYESLYNIGRCWTKFEGSFVDGSKEGPGTIYLTNGHIFTGFFQKDLANGKGSVYINGELALKGTWKNNILITQF